MNETSTSNDKTVPGIRTIIDGIQAMQVARRDESGRLVPAGTKDELIEAKQALENITSPIHAGLGAIGTLLSSHENIEEMPGQCLRDLGALITHLAETLESATRGYSDAQHFITGLEIAEMKESSAMG